MYQKISIVKNDKQIIGATVDTNSKIPTVISGPVPINDMPIPCLPQLTSGSSKVAKLDFWSKNMHTFLKPIKKQISDSYFLRNYPFSTKNSQKIYQNITKSGQILFSSKVFAMFFKVCNHFFAFFIF